MLKEEVMVMVEQLEELNRFKLSVVLGLNMLMNV